MHSATAAAASTAAAAGGRGESRCGCNRKRGEMSAHIAIIRTAVSRVHPTRRVAWWGKATRHNSHVHSAAGKLAADGNGCGAIVSCLQQYQQRWGFVRLATSRAAWPHAIHDQQQQQKQPERSTKGAFVGISSAGS